MGVLVKIGAELPSAVLFLKYNSYNDFSIFFWDNEAGTAASDLTNTTATIEVDTPSTITLATGTRVGVTNEMSFSIPASSMQVTWDDVPFRVVLTKSGTNRYVVASGKVRIQK